jgi:predicted DNA-binding transcriptional regulator AlpA
VNGALQSPAASVEQPTRHEHVTDQHRDLLTTTAICERAGISRWTWRAWVRSGKAPKPVANLPGHPRWKASDIANFLDGRLGYSNRRFFGKAR